MGGQCDENYQKNSDCYASLPLQYSCQILHWDLLL